MTIKFIKISEFSKLTGLSIKALRLYETRGILTPTRSNSNRYRLYNDSQIALAKEISSLKASGFSIREIKALLPFRSQAEAGLLIILEEQLRRNEQSIESLVQQRNQIKQAIKQVKLGVSSVGIDKSFAMKLICTNVSNSIKLLSNKELLEKTKNISNAEYIQTLAMVDNIAKEKLLSVISEKAKKLVKNDLARIDKKYAHFWS